MLCTSSGTPQACLSLFEVYTHRATAILAQSPGFAGPVEATGETSHQLLGVGAHFRVTCLLAVRFGAAVWTLRDRYGH